jgi:uncharacterized LabA/DUF88 family protein
MEKQRVIAYIDGFNLFYSSLKGTPYKWLDLWSMCVSLLKPDQELIAVKYFSAKVSAFSDKDRKDTRQQLYLDALSQNKKIKIMLGYYSVHPMKMPIAEDWRKGKINTIEVMKTEEKGTDVNLAVELVSDAYQDNFDIAMLFSNDSDMAYSVQISRGICKKKIGLYIDRKALTTQVLKKNMCFIKHLGPSVFANNQMPDEITTPTGCIIKKPKGW